MANAKITVTGSTFGLPPEFRTPATRPAAGRTALRHQVPVGWVLLQPDGHPELSVFCELGDDVPDPDGGYGGIVSVSRQLGEPITRFAGFDARTIPMQLIMDAGPSGTVDALYDNLEAIAGRGIRRVAGGPVPCLVDTAGLLRSDASVFPNDRFWVVPSWSKDPDDQITDAAGSRVRAVADVTLTLVGSASDLQSSTIAARAAHDAKNRTASKSYTSVDGDTLIRIARKKLGDAGRWTQLAALNPSIRDPNQKLRSGTRVRLP